MCRSRRELSNEYLLAKIGVDTAENEPLEVWGKIIQYYSFVSLIGTKQASCATHPSRCATCTCPTRAWKYPALMHLGRDASALSKLNSWRLLKLIKIKSARSRLYRSRFLQVNTRWKALAEIYTMHSFAPLWNRSLISKFSLKIAEFFSVFS